MTKIRKGVVIRGVVSGIETYGAFVCCDNYYTGLIHISEISHGYVKNITEFVNIGDSIYVEVLDIDDELGHLKLSIKNINYKQNRRYKRTKIKETPIGFKSLEYKLPIWIEETLKKIKNKQNNG